MAKVVAAMEVENHRMAAALMAKAAMKAEVMVAKRSPAMEAVILLDTEM